MNTKLLLAVLALIACLSRGVFAADPLPIAIVNVDRILSAHGITDRPSKWPMGLSVDDAKAWLERGELP